MGTYILLTDTPNALVVVPDATTTPVDTSTVDEAEEQPMIDPEPLSSDKAVESSGKSLL